VCTRLGLGDRVADVFVKSGSRLCLELAAGVRQTEERESAALNHVAGPFPVMLLRSSVRPMRFCAA
jgi:hypothetical protein